MDEQSNTGRNIIIAIIVIAIIAVLGYFIYNSTLKDDAKAIEDDIDEVVPDMDKDEFDEVGAFSGMETYGDEAANARIELVLNEDKTASLVLNYGSTEKYEGTYTKDGDTITFTTNGTNNDTTDNTANNSASGSNGKNDTTDNAVDDKADNQTSSAKTFTFTIEDNSLYYTSLETNEKVKLDKTSRDTLQYINE